MNSEHSGSGWTFARIMYINFALLAFITILLKLNTKRKRLANLGERAPSVPSRIPLGLDVLVKAVKQIHADQFFEWGRQVLDVPGRTIELRMLGLSIIMTDNPANVKTVLSTKFSSFGKGITFHKIWSDLMLDSVFATDGEVWRANKDYLREHTARIRTSDYAITERHAQNLIRLLSDDEPHDTLTEIDRFSLDVVSDVFFGFSAESLLNNEQPIRDAVEVMYLANTQKLLLGDLGALLPGNKKASKVIDNYLDTLIATASSDAKQDSTDKKRRDESLLGSMIAQGVSHKLIKDQLMAILLGGKDPAAITITWAIYEMAKHPSMLEALRQEIFLVVGKSEPPEAHHLKNMPYLHNVVQETLRLHSPLGFNIRTALRDTTLPTGGGQAGDAPVGVLEGTPIIIANACLQRRHDLIGHDADEFRPGRWDNDWKPAIWAYLPFNHGPRICLGKNFAVMQMEYILCRLFQSFSSVEIVGVGKAKGGEGSVKTKIALNTKPAEPIWLKFVQ